MENLNTERKPLSELIKEAEEKGVTLVLVADPVIDGHHRVQAFIKMDKFMVVYTSSLPESDNETVAKMMAESKPLTTKRDPFEAEPIQLKNYRLEELPENIILNEDNKLHHVVPFNLKTNDLNKRASLPNVGQMKKNMLRNHRRK